MASYYPDALGSQSEEKGNVEQVDRSTAPVALEPFALSEA